MNDARLDNPIPPGLSYPHAASVLAQARTLLVTLIEKFGVPLLVLAMRTYHRFIRNDFLERLRDVEQLLRRFIVYEALALAPTQTPPHRAASPSAPSRKRETILGSDSTRWRACFAILPSAPRDLSLRRQSYAIAAAAAGRAPVPPAIPENYATRALALRLEAVIRIAADPSRPIRRLARRLGRKTPPSLRRVFTAPDTRCEETAGHLGALTLHAIALLQRRADSS